MDTNKRNILVTVLVVCVLVVLGVYNFYYKNTPAKDVLLTPNTVDNTKPVPESNLKITSGSFSPMEVKTDKDKVIKNIIDKKYTEAQISIDALLKKNPEDAELWYINSSLQAALLDIPGAIISVDKALIYDTQNTTYWKWKVSLNIRKMEKDNIKETSAIYISTIKDIYINALKVTNSNIEMISPYAIYLERIGDTKQAIEYWQKAIVINPTAKQSYQAEIERLKTKQ